MVLLGEWFGGGDLWPQIGANLGLPTSLSGPEILGILEACGGLNGDGRLLVAIDALNESGTGDFWRMNLPRLLAEIGHYPHIGLAVSVRSTYLELIDPDGRIGDQCVVTVHPGLAGREIEAVGLYFKHYGLEEPRFSLLTPEFTNPLFLQFYCEAQVESDAEGDVHEGRLKVFDRVVEARLKKIAIQLADGGAALDISLKQRAARTVLDAVLSEMAVSGTERLTLDAVARIVGGLNFEQQLAGRLLTRLEAEGIFTSEEMWVDGEVQLGLRLTFQAFSDHLILNHRVKQRDPTVPITDDEVFRRWLSAASWGIQEAASVLLPERHGIELRDYLGVVVDAAQDELAEYELNRFDRLTMATLPFRTPGSVGDATIDAVNRYLRSSDARLTEFYDVLALIAPIPDHPLNGDGLHDHLSKQPMADRDASFGVATYHALDGQQAFWRLASWARRGPHPRYDGEVIRLATIPLVWLLSSPNRYMRDWLTKVLVQLLSGHIGVLIELSREFAKIDDVYVRERLAGVTYGVLMRNQGAGRETLRPLVIETATLYLNQPDANALLLDHVEGIVEFGLAKGLIEPGEVPNHKVPYGLPRPDHPWTMERIDDHRNSYSQIYFSLFNMGDFGRYRVDSSFNKFTKVLLSEPTPSRSKIIQKVDEKKLARIRANADPEVLAEVDSLDMSVLPTLESVMARLDHETDAARNLRSQLASCRYTVKEPDFDYPTERARRWIFMKAIKLGWTEKRFGHFEDMYARESGRSASKPERFGKKYQWIAYHELLARIRDNYHPKPGYGENEPSRFLGLWDTFDRDIDPSIQAVASFDELDRDRGESDSSLVRRQSGIVSPGLDAINLSHYLARDVDFLTDYAGYPKAEDLVDAADSAGERWFVLSAYHPVKVPDETMEFGMSMDQATICSTWLVPSTQAKEAVAAVRSLGHGLEVEPYGLWDRNGHVDCCYLGEIGWRNQGCYHRAFEPVRLEYRDEPVELVSATEEYTWEAGRFDCSILDTTKLVTPSARVLETSEVTWDGNVAFRGHSGSVELVEVGAHGFGASHMLVARRDWLSEWLAKENLALIVRAWSERRDFRHKPARNFHELSSLVAYDSSLRLLERAQSHGSF